MLELAQVHAHYGKSHVLQGVDLTNTGALSTDQQIIQDLLTRGKLITDANG